MKNFYETFQRILIDKKLSREEKIALLQEAKSNYDRQIMQERNKEIAKYGMGALLEMASALPVGRVGNLGAQVAMNALKSNLGRKIPQELGSGIASGVASGAVFGAGRGMLEDKNPLQTSAQDALTFGLVGGALGAGGANIFRGIKSQQLKNYGNIDELDEVLRKQYNKDSRKFYQDYIQDIKLNKNGEFDFTRRGIQEQLRWNPKQTQNYPELVKDIKQTKRLPDIPNAKLGQKPDVSHYEVYRGKNGDHYIEVSESGKKRYYITKESPSGSDRTTSSGTTRSPNPILQNNSSKVNPTNGQLEQIFTRERIKNMTTDEFLKNEKAIMQQLKEKGIPTNRELEEKRKKTTSSGKGRWVTINGNHVFIED